MRALLVIRQRQARLTCPAGGRLLVLRAGDAAPAQGSVAMDRVALVALYDATDGASWTTNTNWSTTAALSTWHGVTIDSDGLRVTELNLIGNNKLTGSIPAELGDLTSLQELYLWGNTDLTGPLPLGIMNFNVLTTVWIQDTGLCAPKEKEYLRWQVLRETRKFRLTSHQFNLSNKHSEAERHAQDSWSGCCFAVDCIGQCGGPG